jgi:hypothetical protein
MFLIFLNEKSQFDYFSNFDSISYFNQLVSITELLYLRMVFIMQILKNLK